MTYSITPTPISRLTFVFWSMIEASVLGALGASLSPAVGVLVFASFFLYLLVRCFRLRFEICTGSMTIRNRYRTYSFPVSEVRDIELGHVYGKGPSVVRLRLRKTCRWRLGVQIEAGAGSSSIRWNAQASAIEAAMCETA